MKHLALCLCLSLACYGQLPQADASGEYSRRTLHTHWRVVDPDPEGLNGRLARDFPVNYDSVAAPWPSSPPLSWPVVARFASGSLLRARTGNVGVIRIKDPQGRSWMMVSRPEGSGICFVRAHQRYIRPVDPDSKP